MYAQPLSDVHFTVRHGCVTEPFGQRNRRHINLASDALVENQQLEQPEQSRRMIMKTILSALVALSVLAGIAAAPASANESYNSSIGGRDVGLSSPL